MQESAPVFENTGCYDRLSVQQALWRTLRGRRIYFLCAGIFFTLLSILYFLLPDQALRRYAVIFVWIAAAMFALIFLDSLVLNKKLTRRQIRAFTETYGRESCEYKLSFFKDSVRLQNLTSGAQAVIRYESCRRLFKTRDLYLLQTDAKQIIPIFKSGFSGIRAEEFIPLLRQYAPHVRIR